MNTLSPFLLELILDYSNEPTKKEFRKINLFCNNIVNDTIHKLTIHKMSRKLNNFILFRLNNLRELFLCDFDIKKPLMVNHLEFISKINTLSKLDISRSFICIPKNKLKDNSTPEIDHLNNNLDEKSLDVMNPTNIKTLIFSENVQTNVPSHVFAKWINTFVDLKYLAIIDSFYNPKYKNYNTFIILFYYWNNLHLT